MKEIRELSILRGYTQTESAADEMLGKITFSEEAGCWIQESQPRAQAPASAFKTKTWLGGE